MTRLCKVCQEPIPPARLAALPAATTCVAHSEEQPLRGWMTWDHKTAPTLQVGTQEQLEDFKRLDRRGVHASLPMSSKKVGATTEAGPGVTTRTKSDDVEIDTVWNRPKARCHPDRPKASSDGKCLECAQAWYALRRSRPDA